MTCLHDRPNPAGQRPKSLSSRSSRFSENLEKAIRCVGFLLKYCSEIGNEPVNGFASFGLGYVLDRIADTTESAIRRQKKTKRSRAGL